MDTSKTTQQKISKYLCLIGLLIIASYVYLYITVPDTTKVYIFDVGQGSSTFIRTKEGIDILIDGGPNNEVVTHLNKVMPMHDRTIDIMILTHPHYDHLYGLLEVARNFEIKKTYVSMTAYDSYTYQEFLKLVDEIMVTKPLRFVIDNDTYFEIVFPTHAMKDIKNANNASIVSRFVDVGKSILIPGDAEEEQEEEMLERALRVDSDLLVAGHHGSRTSSTQEFLDAVSPQHVFISAGKDNKYKHPHPETLEKLIQTQIPAWETSNGTITITFEEGSYHIEQ